MPVIMGIRPEDILDNYFAENKDSANTISADIEMVENMGSHQVVHFKRGSYAFSASPKNFDTDKQGLDLVFDMKKSHFFHPDSSQII